ncbi:hypothetical protein [Phosphitispora fastidiosa]|uniref:hypothetical protein n=1 Tax=Phosphitispora fastidiosa TaxID=2837202 RepID=UPI001E4451AC|nr:hypothetical protein [Phosphitispora fastidiosa]MBU7008074.1 hypothetical protein [Phosphitispora fastidiosa]
MNNENKKKGLFESLFGSKKDKKGSCCGSFQIEELPEENTEKKDSEASLKKQI